MSSSGTFCHGEKYFVPLGVVMLQLNSSKIVEVKKIFACSTDLEVVINDVSVLAMCHQWCVRQSIEWYLLIRHLLGTFLLQRKKNFAGEKLQSERD